MPVAEPPFSRLMRGFIVKPETGCWIWQGHKYSNGYGAIKVFGKMGLAHRLSYELHKGAIPAGEEVLHSCDVRDCVNPDHLASGTHLKNMQDAKAKGKMRSGDKHPFFGKRQSRPKQAKPVMVLGVIYDSQKEAERALSLGSGTVRYWIKTNSPKASHVKKEN